MVLEKFLSVVVRVQNHPKTRSLVNNAAILKVSYIVSLVLSAQPVDIFDLYVHLWWLILV